MVIKTYLRSQIRLELLVVLSYGVMVALQFFDSVGGGFDPPGTSVHLNHCLEDEMLSIFVSFITHFMAFISIIK